jgi:hypothetical protein
MLPGGRCQVALDGPAFDCSFCGSDILIGYPVTKLGPGDQMLQPRDGFRFGGSKDRWTSSP